MDASYFEQDETVRDKVPPEKIFQKRNSIPFRLVIHHSAGPQYSGYESDRIAAIFGTEGKKLFRHFEPDGKETEIKSYLENPFTGSTTWANAQFALHPYGKEYRLVKLVKYPMSDICWHASNKEINDTSFGVEICGNYYGEFGLPGLLSEGIDALSRVFRPYAQWLRETTGKELIITGHRDHAPTACPGNIYRQLSTIRDAIL